MGELAGVVSKADALFTLECFLKGVKRAVFCRALCDSDCPRMLFNILFPASAVLSALVGVCVL